MTNPAGKFKNITTGESENIDKSIKNRPAVNNPMPRATGCPKPEIL